MKNQPVVFIVIVIATLGCCLVLFNDWMKIVFSRIFKLNSPSFVEEQFKNSKYRLSKPTDYNQSSVIIKKYPLVVFLHGGGKQGNDNKMPSYGLRFLGNGFNKQAKSYQVRYQSFVYVPQCPSGKSWRDKDTLALLISTIEHLQSKYPIDMERLYLIGYSMGGSGTYYLANHYYTSHKKLFAGIIRLAGQSSYEKQVHEIISQSAIWLHVGLQDTDLRIEKAREAYKILKGFHKKSIETTQEITLRKHPGTTRTLFVNNRERVKLSEYQNDGHSIAGFPFQDSFVLDWLFTQIRPQNKSP